MSPRRAVVVMAKQARPGHSKTRLVPPLTPATAAGLAEAFLADTVDLMRSVPGVTPFVAVHPPGSEAWFAERAPGVGQVPQVGERLGDRLHHVLSALLADGYDQVAAVNGDGPTLPADRVVRAFGELDRPDVDVVFGPADDGGYYLVGVTEPPGPLVRDVPMSTPTVLVDSLAVAAGLGRRVALLDPWFDVDEPADLHRLMLDLERDAHAAPHTRRYLADLSQPSASP